MYVQCCNDCRPGWRTVVLSVCTESGGVMLGVFASVVLAVCLAVLLVVCTILGPVLRAVGCAELLCVWRAVSLSVFPCVFLAVCTSCFWLYVGMYFWLCASVCSAVYVQCNLLASRCVWSSVVGFVVYCVCTHLPGHPTTLGSPLPSQCTWLRRLRP